MVTDDVVLIQQDAHVTTVDLTSAAPVQVVQGSQVTDNDGTRQATVLFPQGTQALMTLPDGSTQPLTSLHVRATEYTVGDNGPKAMPGELPSNTAYTYAVELSADEAIAAGARTVSFDKPVPFYVQNFLNFPVGTTAPLGYYDLTKGQWIPADSGRVIKIIAITDGVAAVDTDGDGTADDAPGLNLGEAERRTLATLYGVDTSLWRVTVNHFSAWDVNWGWGPPDDAEFPKQVKPSSKRLDCPTQQPARSTIGCEIQSLGETLKVAGTPYTLNYQSDRVPGRKAVMDIPLSGNKLPGSIVSIKLVVEVAGRRFETDYPGQPNQRAHFEWDGRDAYGQTVRGTQIATVRIGYVYRGGYKATPRFGYNGGGNITAGYNTMQMRLELTLWQTHEVQLDVWDARGDGLGGWTLNQHHAYDPVGRRLFLGTGQTVSSERIDRVIQTVAGTGVFSMGYDPRNDVPATEVGLGYIDDLALAPDGSLYIAVSGINDRQGGQWWVALRRVDPQGLIHTVAESASGDFHGDGGSVGNAGFAGNILALAFGPDGSLYIAEPFRVRRVTPDGIIRTVAGNGEKRPTSQPIGDGGPATAAPLLGVAGLAVGSEGTLYLTDERAIRRVTTDGVISTILYNPYCNVYRIAISPDDALYLSCSYTIDRPPEKCISYIQRYNSDATFDNIFTQYDWTYDIAFSRDGTLYIAGTEGYIVRYRILQMDNAGTVSVLAGKCRVGPSSGDGGPAADACLYPYEISVAPDASVYAADGDRSIRRIGPNLLGLSAGDFSVASRDGSELYIFDFTGRHLRTLNPLTNAVLYEFGYDSAGRLASVKDGDGNVTTIERDGSGNATAIVAPFGQRTALSLDTNGYLASLTNPAGESHSMAYSATGLLSRLTTPLGNSSTFEYDAIGRLVKDSNALGGAVTLSRTDVLLGQKYEVEFRSAQGQTTTYGVESLPTGEDKRTTLDPDGTLSTWLKAPDGSYQSTFPDGTSSLLQTGPDPRFKMQTPLSKGLTLTSGGLTMAAGLDRTVSLNDPDNVLSLTTLTDTFTVNGRTATSVFDAATRIVSATSAAGRRSQSLIDRLGRITESRVMGLEPVRTAYDARGRLAAVTQGAAPDDRTLSLAYNPAGYLESITDPLGRSASYEYDLAGRVTKQILPDGNAIIFTYDKNGNLTSLTPPGQPAHLFQYDQVDQQTQYSPPDVAAGTNNTVYAYNLDKQLTRISRPDGETLQFSYDNAGRLSQLAIPDGNIGYTYDATTSQLTRITATDGGTLTFGYSGALLAQTTWAGEIAGSVGRTYDNDFRVTAFNVNGNNPIGYQYDGDSLLMKAGDLSLTRSGQNGLLTGSVLGLVNDSFGYNGFGEVTSYQASLATGAGVSSLVQFGYTRDKPGRITQKTEALDGGSPDSYDYGYDPAGRLAEVKKNGVPQAKYTYDANGNRLKYEGVSVIEGRYDAQDRLLQYGTTTYTYTANGELQSKNEGGAVTQYRYDVLGNLKHVELPSGPKIDYLVDGKNRRIGKKIDGTLVQGFLYQDQLKPIAELDGSGNIVSRFIYGTHVNVPDYMIKGGTTYRLITDHLGSPRLVVNTADGTVMQRMAYDEFGKVLQDTNRGFQPFGFAGGLYDRDTKLVRFGARDYDAEIGRWTAKDPIGFDSYDANLFNYSGYDPINLIDTDGRLVGKIIDKAKEELEKLKDPQWWKNKAKDLAEDAIQQGLEKGLEKLDKPGLGTVTDPSQIAQGLTTWGKGIICPSQAPHPWKDLDELEESMRLRREPAKRFEFDGKMNLKKKDFGLNVKWRF